MGTPVWIEYGERATGDNDPVYGVSGIVNRPAKTIWSMLTAEHGTDGTHNTGVIDQAEINLTSAAAANGDAVRYDEYSVHTHSQVAGLSVHTGRNNEANKLVRTNAWGQIDVQYVNFSNGQELINLTSFFAEHDNDGFVRKASVSYVAQNTYIARMAVGSYTGTGSSLTVNLSPAITPRALMVSVPSGAPYFAMFTSAGSTQSGVTFYAGYFTVGGGAPMNVNGSVYQYIAWGY